MVYIFNQTIIQSFKNLKIMALLFQAAIYGTNSNATGGATGQYMAFPSNSVLVRPAIPTQTFSGVTVNSIIQLLPSGTVVNQPQYYSSLSVSAIVSLANA